MNVSTSSAAVSDAGDRPRLYGLAWAHFLNDGATNYLPGVLPDWFGGRGFIVAGLACSSFGAALVGLMPGYASLVCLLILIGVSNSLFHPQAMAVARQVGGRRHGASMSVFLVGGEIGRGAWPLLASGLVVMFGLDALWLLSLPARGSQAAPLSLRHHGGPMTRLVAFASLRTLMVFSVITFMPVIWHMQGGSLTGGASFATVLLLVGIIGNLGGGRMADRMGRRPVLIMAIGASTLLLAGFIVADGALAWLLLALLGITLFATLPLTVLIGQDILPDNRSFGSGLALGLSNAVAAFGVMGLGLAAAAWNPYAALWAAVAGGLVAFLLAFTLPD